MVFTGFRQTLDVLVAAVERAGLPSASYHGSLTRREKESAIAEFAAETPILLSTESAGEGRNLQFCHVMVNFDLPYLSRNPSEFWRRWHISLSSWLRDYLYVSLGGNRMGERRTYANLMATMVLGGLWHGAAVNYILWGAYQGGLLCVHRAVTGKRHTLPTGRAAVTDHAPGRCAGR